MRILQNFYKATITLDWSIGTGNFYVSVKPTVTEGWLVLSPNNVSLREIVRYTNTGTDANGDYITVAERAVGGTSEQTHAVGEPIRMNITAEYWDDMNDDIQSIVAAGAVNASNSAKGILEIATSTEVDAGTEIGGTGASLALTPKNVSDSHNIPHVAPGTAGNLLTSDGTDWISSPAVVPTPFFQQELPMSQAFVSGRKAFGANTDGSVFYSIMDGGTLERWARDTLTGYYIRTHTTSSGVSVPAGDYSSIVVLGSFVYLFSNDGTNVIVTRFNAADLTSNTVCTVPTVAHNSVIVAWTDGTHFYFVTNTADTVCRKWSLSGTTFSAVSTSTVTTGVFANSHMSSMYDGVATRVCQLDRSNDRFRILKLTNADGTAYTTTDKQIFDVSDSDQGCCPIPIDTTKMYMGFFTVIYNASAASAYKMHLIPITKP